jgi:Ras-related protein Rab-21
VDSSTIVVYSKHFTLHKNTHKLSSLNNLKKGARISKLYLCIARVGKTSLSLRFAQNQFDEHQQSTMDATCLTPTVEISGGKQQQIAIWDTAGQERYHCLNPVYYRNSEGK